MLCARPFRRSKSEFGCGQCLPCRVNKRREWTTRILLESYCHQDNAFVTLTYKDPAPENVMVSEVQKFMRKLWRSTPVRFFAVGEYGDKHGRAHYHLALFGFPLTRVDLLEEAWTNDQGESKGFVHVGELNAHTAAYIGGYISKKWTRRTDFNEDKLDGRAPEFARMSLKPGIGAGFADATAAKFVSESGSVALAALDDVPSTVRVEGKLMPIGRYLRQRMRRAVGGDGKQPIAAKARLEAERSEEDPRLREAKRYQQELIAEFRSQLAKTKRRI